MKTRKGFTLVELLIVIVVIGILSAMMMLSSTEAVSSAKASNVISNMRNIKTAALAYYADNMDSCDVNYKETTQLPLDQIIEYLSSGTKDIPDIANYSVWTANGGRASQEKGWYVKYNVHDAYHAKMSIISKLAGRAKSVGLLNDGGSLTGDDSTYTDKDTCAMRIK